jgi:hypothetical protein
MGLSTVMAWGAFVVVFILVVLIRSGEIGADAEKKSLRQREKDRERRRA